eukprot:2629093-Rhodomonas_salina.2
MDASWRDVNMNESPQRASNSPSWQQHTLSQHGISHKKCFGRLIRGVPETLLPRDAGEQEAGGSVPSEIKVGELGASERKLKGAYANSITALALESFFPKRQASRALERPLFHWAILVLARRLSLWMRAGDDDGRGRLAGRGMC